MFLGCTKREENSCIFAVEFYEKAVQKGIKVVCVDVDISNSKRPICISSDSYGDEKLGGRLLGGN